MDIVFGKILALKMQPKTVTYQRVLNLGNYESKRLELTAEISAEDDLEAKISRLMELVERKVREDTYTQLEEEIRQLKKQLREIQQQVNTAKSSENKEEPDDIPFDRATQSEDENLDNF